MKEKQWLIEYRYTFGADVYKGTYEEAENWAVEQVKKDLETDKDFKFPITVYDCDRYVTCNCYKDLITSITEYRFEDEE